MSANNELPPPIGDYEMLEEAGCGPLGVVYRARHIAKGIPAAVKLLFPEPSRNEGFARRFLREGELGPELVHPHVVSVFDRGRSNDRLFCATRWVEGRDLGATLRRTGRFEPIRVLRILRQVASALDAAHGSGQVHRNLKPQNILLLDVPPDAPDVAYVTDFGMARPAGSESTLVRPHHLSASLHYLAPEQIEGRPCDGRTDVYSLGCLVFEALTGCSPYEGTKQTELMWAHVHAEPLAMGTIDGDLSHLDAPLRVALAKHPDDRYLTCGEFVDALDEALTRKKLRRGLRLGGLHLGRLR